MIRPASSFDAEALHRLMLQLAEVEGYSEEFVVTRDDLLRLGLRHGDEQSFHCLVAEADRDLVAYALTYVIPFTYDLRPTVVLKELFVRSEYRSRGIGNRLFSAVVAQARTSSARLLRWQVLPSNSAAKEFYLHRGGKPDRHWESWELDLDGACDEIGS